MDFRNYLTLEVALTRKLSKTWDSASADLLGKLQKAVDAEDWDEAKDLVDDLDLSPVLDQNREYVRYTLAALASFGSAMAGGGDKPWFMSSDESQSPLDVAVDQMDSYFTHDGTSQLRTAALQLIAKAQEPPVQKAEDDAPPRMIKPFVSFAGVGMDQVQIASTLNSSRVAAWGFLGEADLLGETEYKLVAVLDGRTSPFCRYVANGKTFRVADARPLIQQALTTTNPNDLKTIQPWPNQSKSSIAELRNLTSDQLKSMGFMVPPFHPGCRTILTRTDSALPATVVKPVQTTLPPTVSTAETFQELGVDLTDEQIQDWNSYMGVSPSALLAKLTNTTPMDLLDSAWKKLFFVSDQGEVGVGAKGVINDVKFQIGTTFDPFGGKVYLDKADLNADTEAARGFIKNLFLSLGEVGQDLGATATITAVAAGQCLSYVSMGYLPNQLDWEYMRQEGLDMIQSGDLKPFYDDLSPNQQTLLQSLLGSQDSKSLYVLAELPWSYEGKTVGEWLTESYSGNMVLNLQDSDATALLKGNLS